MKKLITVLLTLCFIFTLPSMVKAEDRTVTAIYFYSPTCSTCHKIEYFLNDIKKEFSYFDLRKYNITDVKNKSLLDKYSQTYFLSSDDEGVVPVIFIGDKYFIGERSIRSNLRKELSRSDIPSTKILGSGTDNFNSSIQQFLNFRVASVFVAGLINGINPCSMSMLLFFLSLLMIKRVNILRIGFVFSTGKFIAFLLLGTIFFNILSKINLSWIHNVIKIVVLFIILILVVLNLQDFFAAKKERYEKIRLQLPHKLRKINHTLIKRVAGISNLHTLLLISFVLGFIISFGEFLCTGQIYLATIVTILQTTSYLNFQAFVYLGLYAFGFILPLLILSLLVHKGREIFDISEVIREKLQLIKLINLIIFIVFALFIIFLF